MKTLKKGPTSKEKRQLEVEQKKQIAKFIQDLPKGVKDLNEKELLLFIAGNQMVAMKNTNTAIDNTLVLEGKITDVMNHFGIAANGGKPKSPIIGG